MKKEQNTIKRGTDSEKGSATQAVVRGLVSKICKNSDPQVTKEKKKPCFVSCKEGCAEVLPIFPKRGSSPSQSSAGKGSEPLALARSQGGLSCSLRIGHSGPGGSIQCLEVWGLVRSPVWFCL